MSSPPRLPLVDLITELSLHSDRRHLYVEGRSDRAVVEHLLDIAPLSDIQVFEIDCLDISYEDLQRYELTDGVRNRVLLLARELENALPDTAAQVLCVVDADYDYILGRLITSRFLAYTDGTSLEMYAFTEACIDRLFKMGFREPNLVASRILACLADPLQEIFVVRAANEHLQLGLEWLPFSKRCKIAKDGSISFDATRFIKDYLSKNGALKSEKKFFSCRDLLKRQLGDRPCRCIRGHDFTELLAKYVRARCKAKKIAQIATDEVISRMLFVSFDVAEFRSSNLFQRILAIFGNVSDLERPAT